MYPCPRCEQPLDEGDLAGHDILRCPAECGLIVEQRSMVPVTDMLATATLDSIDLDSPIPVAPHDPTQRASCPGCRGTMDAFGYQGTRFVHLDRCTSCAVLWIDKDELEVVVRMVARNLGHLQRHHERRRELSRSLSRLVWIGNSDGRYLPV